jgi:hypothetical protein
VRFSLRKTITTSTSEISGSSRKSFAIFTAIQRSAGCVSALMTGSGAVFAIARRGSKDASRLNPSGAQESANGQRETLSAGGPTPLKPRQGLTPDFLLRGPSRGSLCGFL